MTWWEYVTRTAAGEEQAVIAKRAGVGQSMVSRWQTSTPRPENVAAFARAYNRPVLEAFIAAGFLSSDEAGEQPTAPPSLTTLTDEELLEEVARRMKGERDAGKSNQKISGDPVRVTTQDDVTTAARTGRSAIQAYRDEQDRAGEESQDVGE